MLLNENKIMITTGKRPLSEISDRELETLLDISMCYGAKEFWGDIEVVRINRYRNKGEITITYIQRRVSDGMVAKWRMFFDFAHLRYFYSQDEPFSRMSRGYSFCESTQMFLWLMAQDFNVLEVLTVAPFEGHNGGTMCSHGYVVYDGFNNPFDDKDTRFFGYDDEDEAFLYADTKKGRHFKVFGLVEIKMQEESVNKKPIEGEFPYNNPSDTLSREIENIWNKLSVDGLFTATKDGFAEVVTHFAEWQKRQMMKDAFTGTVWLNKEKRPYVPLFVGLEGKNPGDRVKVIVIKEG